MTVDEALNGVVRLGIDTAPFIYFVEANPAYASVCREVFRRVDAGMVEIGSQSRRRVLRKLTQRYGSRRVSLTSARTKV